MKNKKAASKKAAPAKSAAKSGPVKPIKDALSKSGLVAHLSEQSGVAARDVRAVLASLEGAVSGSICKKGAGSFTLPGLLKISAVNVPALATVDISVRIRDIMEYFVGELTERRAQARLRRLQ